MTDDVCGCTKRDGTGDECQLPSGWGTGNDSGPCKYHGGSGGAPEENDNATDHGAFKEHFRSDLVDDEIDAIDALVKDLQDVEGFKAVPAEVAAEALMKYKRSGDSRFLREARQWFSEFNLVENADTIKHEGSGIVISTEAPDGDGS